MAPGGNVLDRISKAAERELSRVKQAARALQHYMKQWQVSRERERTVRHEVREFARKHGHHLKDVERNPADDEKRQKMVFYNSLAHRNLCRGSLTCHDITHEGWKVAAMYRNNTDEAGGGRYLAYNILRQEVLLSEYTRCYCYICNLYASGNSYPSDNVKAILEDPCNALSHEQTILAPAKTFLVIAQRLNVSAMTHRRVQPEDRDYHSLVTLYAAYTLFHSRVVQPRCLGKWPSERAVYVLAAWRPREWTRRRYEALVRVQALWRGWHFRQRVLYSPHTELGRRYLLQAWRRDLEHFVPG